MKNLDFRTVGKSAYKKANQMLGGELNISMKDFSVDELKCFLLTIDGMGREFKINVIDELAERIKDDERKKYDELSRDMAIEREFVEKD